jgi:hypothetical protein
MNVVKSGTFKLPFRDKILASTPSMYQIQLIHFSMSLAHMAINLHLLRMFVAVVRDQAVRPVRIGDRGASRAAFGG